MDEKDKKCTYCYLIVGYLCFKNISRLFGTIWIIYPRKALEITYFIFKYERMKQLKYCYLYSKAYHFLLLCGIPVFSDSQFTNFTNL